MSEFIPHLDPLYHISTQLNIKTDWNSDWEITLGDLQRKRGRFQTHIGSWLYNSDLGIKAKTNVLSSRIKTLVTQFPTV